MISNSDRPPGDQKEPLRAVQDTPSAELHRSSRAHPLELIDPRWDSFLLGGFSIILFAIIHMSIDASVATTSIATTAYWLTFIINKPHFMLSYWLFYRDYKPGNQRKLRWWFTFASVPAAMVALIAWGFLKSEAWPFQWLIHAMYFLVGWHYIKQVFGIMMFRGRYDGYIFDKGLRRCLLLNLGSLWLLSWLAWNRSGQEYQFFGVKYHGLEMAQWPWTALWVLFSISGLGLLVLLVRRYVDQAKWPSLSVVTPFVALYCWYIPSFYHPAYFLFIPLFHSLQYLVFAASLKRNLIEKQIAHLQDREWRKRYLMMGVCFGGGLIVLGALFFKWLPEFIDQRGFYDEAVLGTTLVAGAATLFINIHHYFIDSVLWRKDSPLMK